MSPIAAPARKAVFTVAAPFVERVLASEHADYFLAHEISRQQDGSLRVHADPAELATRLDALLPEPPGDEPPGPQNFVEWAIACIEALDAAGERMSL